MLDCSRVSKDHTRFKEENITSWLVDTCAGGCLMAGPIALPLRVSPAQFEHVGLFLRLFVVAAPGPNPRLAPWFWETRTIEQCRCCWRSRSCKHQKPPAQQVFGGDMCVA